MVLNDMVKERKKWQIMKDIEVKDYDVETIWKEVYVCELKFAIKWEVGEESLVVQDFNPHLGDRG